VIAISKGEFDRSPLESGDEFGPGQHEISRSKQLRGVGRNPQTWREDLDQVSADSMRSVVVPRRRPGREWSVPRRRFLASLRSSSGPPRGRYFSLRIIRKGSYQTASQCGKVRAPVGTHLARGVRSICPSGRDLPRRDTRVQRPNADHDCRAERCGIPESRESHAVQGLPIPASLQTYE